MTSADKPKNMLSVIAQINDKFNKVERKYDAQQLNSCIRNRETIVGNVNPTQSCGLINPRNHGKHVSNKMIWRSLRNRDLKTKSKNTFN